MPTYQLQIKQVVDYPRCRIYRQFVRFLMEDRSIRVSGGSGLFLFYGTLQLRKLPHLISPHRRHQLYRLPWRMGLHPQGAVPMVPYPFQCQALAVLERLQKQHLISFQTLGHGM